MFGRGEPLDSIFGSLFDKDLVELLLLLLISEEEELLLLFEQLDVRCEVQLNILVGHLDIFDQLLVVDAVKLFLI